jgi:hypothetical protein
MSNLKLREGQPIGMGLKALVQKPTKDRVKNPKQQTKAKKPKGGY